MIRGHVKLSRNVSTPKWNSRIFLSNGRPVDDQTTRKRGRPRKNDHAVEGQPMLSDGVVAPFASNGRENVSTTQSLSLRQSKEQPSVEAQPSAGNQTPRASKKTTSFSAALPPRLNGSQTPHDDLASFLKYAAETSMSESSTVYKGTLYEYTVARCLLAYNFELQRKGRPKDRGVDLAGYWNLPGHSRAHPHNLKVIVQCKHMRAQPSMIRELEGSYNGAPAGWNDRDVLSLLVTSKEGTKGVHEAMQMSSWPMGLMQISEEGELRQFLWNEHAGRAGLEGVGVAVKYGNEGAKGTDAIALTWMGSIWHTGRGKK